MFIERPIIFNSDMVRAILEGRKTMTRRPIKSQPLFKESSLSDFCTKHGRSLNKCCPYGNVGDRLWVRETTEIDEDASDSVCLSRYSADKSPVLYSGCDDEEFNGTVAHWDYHRDVRPSIHMPRWASRITLEITNVRVERVQEITEADAMAEGVELIESEREVGFKDYQNEGGNYIQSKHSFRSLWDSIYSEKYPWKSNPWVWVIELRRVL